MRLLLLATMVVLIAGPRAHPSIEWEFAGGSERWPPPVRAIERSRADALAALFRARGSVEGVLGACEAFAALGDREVVTACVRVARDLAGADHAEDRRRALEQSKTRRP